MGTVLIVLESVGIVARFRGVVRNVVILVEAGAQRRREVVVVRSLRTRDDQSSEQKIHALTMATTTSTSVTFTDKSPGAHGGYGYSGYSLGASEPRSGATTPTDSRSILPPFTKEVYSRANDNINVNN